MLYNIITFYIFLLLLHPIVVLEEIEKRTYAYKLTKIAGFHSMPPITRNGLWAWVFSFLLGVVLLSGVFRAIIRYKLIKSYNKIKTIIIKQKLQI